MDKLNPSAETDSIKRLVDEVMSVKFEQANKLRNTERGTLDQIQIRSTITCHLIKSKSIQSFVLLPNT